MHFVKVIFLIVFNYYSSTNGYIVEPGPQVKATVGEIWPKPAEIQSNDKFFVVRPRLLSFEATNHTCDILNKAMERYLRMINSFVTRRRLKYQEKNQQSSGTDGRSYRHDELFEGYLDSIKIDLKEPCEEYPSTEMKEDYQFTLDKETANIESHSIWGVLRGLESFSQLLVLSDDNLSLRINSTRINDYPRFKFRGLLLDTSRHFINMFTIQQILDGMAYNKMNVFHWHIVDDHSFPYESTTYPELSQTGAFHPTMVYTQKNVRQVIEYAQYRGIRVVSEFDTPGHTRSWGVSHPEILTQCEGKYEGKLGPINPIVEESYTFMSNLLSEVAQIFPDKYIHLGGDEVGFECWASNQNITDFMTKKNIGSYQQLEEIYIQRIVDIVSKLNANSIVWQEVYENRVRLPNGTVVHVWTGNSPSLLSQITKEGLPALLSTCWYLDHLSTGGDWKKFYACDPHDFSGSEAQKALVLGGAACMWSEVVDNGNVLQRIFPRASAAAEKLWSRKEDVQDEEEAARRLEEHTCRMKNRGLPAQPPNGPGFCL